MNTSAWYIAIGLVFSAMALAVTLVRRIPLSSAMVYLAVGWLLGPHALKMLSLNPLEHAEVIHDVAEVAVIISLFAAGLKIRAPWSDGRWLIALRLATASMVLTVLLIALAGRVLLDLPWGAALLLGGMLAPTDPVLASEVQLEHPYDPSWLRFSLTGEAGLNDGAAFPFVLLGLAMLGLPGGETGWRWVAWDLGYGTIIALFIGGALGAGLGNYVLHLREKHHQALGLGFFLAPGLIALSYGLATVCGGYGFLAVFAAGVALRHVELREVGEQPSRELTELAYAPAEREDVATDPQKAPVYLVQSLLGFAEQLEQIGEVVVVAMVGAMLGLNLLSLESLWFACLVFFLIRPASVAVGLFRSPLPPRVRGYVAWFGIRGIGTVYYLAYVVTQGLPTDLAQRLATLTLGVVTLSVLVHGISVTPLMNRYDRDRPAIVREARRKLMEEA